MRRSILLSLAAIAVAGQLSPAPAQDARPSAAQQKRAKATPPPPLPMAKVEFPPFVERSLANGAQLLIVEHHEQPVVSISIYIRGAGRTSDAEDKPSVASFTAALLDAGTTSKSSKQIAETVEGLGANLSTAAADDWATISATMLKSDVDQILAVIADLLLNPTFPADELETERNRSLTSLQVALSRPATLAARQFQATIFGKHPYGRLTTTAGLRAITRDDLVTFHKTYYKPSNALIVVAGDVDPAQVTAKLEQQLGAWTGRGPARPQFAAAPTPTAREIILVNKPGTVQANFRIGHAIVPAPHPDWPALRVAEQILGGGSRAWLYRILRDEKGFTYAAYAESTRRLDPGDYQLWGDVRNEVADSALELFLTLAEKLKNEPVPASDLEAAKSRLTGVFPLSIETPSQIAGQVASSRLLGQAKDHVQTWRTRVAAVTAADVQRVAKAHLHPENAFIIVAGDASLLKPMLEKFGKVTVVDEEGRPVAAAASAAETTPLDFDASSIQPQELTYTTTYQGMQVSEVTRLITRDNTDGQDIVNSASTSTGMISGKSELRIDARTFAPLSSNVSQQAGGKEMSWLLSVADGKVSGTVTMPDTEPKTIDAAFADGTLLPGMDELALWAADLGSVKEFTLNAFDPMSGAIVPVTMKVTGESKQNVAAGEFEVYELEMKTAQGGMKAYVRKAAPHILIKQELLEQPVVTELTSLK